MISFPLNIAKALSRADEGPASTTANPPQSVSDPHRPLPFAICSASAPVVAGALCRQGTTAEYDGMPSLLRGECDHAVFREHVLLLVYNARTR